MRNEFWEERGIAYRINVFDSSRQTLVFIHGLGSACSGWEYYETVLENEYNILTYDLRGHGFSRKYRNYADYDLRNLRDDLQELLNRLNIGTCSFISHSIGALVALLYIHSNPERVRTNLLLAPVYKQPSLTSGETKGNRSALLALLARTPFSPRDGKRVDYSRFEHSGDLELRRFIPEVRSVSLRIYLFYLYQMHFFSDHGLWSQMRIPTTIVHGTKDPFMRPQLVVELSRVIPNATLVTLEGANHIVNINNKKEVIAQIRSQ
jgi:pimeloyl-ACP methyl ester carboxylesterase